MEVMVIMLAMTAIEMKEAMVAMVGSGSNSGWHVAIAAMVSMELMQ